MDLDKATNHDWNPLSIANHEGHGECVKVLVRACCMVALPCQFAARRERPEWHSGESSGPYSASPPSNRCLLLPSVSCDLPWERAIAKRKAAAHIVVRLGLASPNRTTTAQVLPLRPHCCPVLHDALAGDGAAN